MIDVREAVRIAAEASIGAYLKETMRKEDSSPGRGLTKGVNAYKAVLQHFDRQGLFVGDIHFAEHFNGGLVLLRRFHEKALNSLYDRPVHGPIRDLSYPVGDDFILGGVSGLICYNHQSRDDRRYSVVVIAPEEKVRTTYHRLREGFAHGAMRRAMRGLRSFPLTMLRVDPMVRTISEYSISAEDQTRFEAIASAALAGIKNEVFLPQPSIAACTRCSFRRACDVKYCRPDESEYHKRRFLEEVK